MSINSISITKLIESLCNIFDISDEKLYRNLSDIAYNSNDDIFEKNNDKFMVEDYQ